MQTLAAAPLARAVGGDRLPIGLREETDLEQADGKT
jgi:hypothetical protein